MRHLRFSVLTSLLLLTIAAMAVALVRLAMEVEPLRREVLQLRKETGRLTIDDPTRLHAVAAETTERDYYVWRVYIPKTPTLFLHRHEFDIPKSGIPGGREYRGGMPLLPGEHVFTMRLKNLPGPDDALIAYFRDRSETNYGGDEFVVRERKADWLNTPYSPHMIVEGGEAVWQIQKSVEVSEPLVLMRMRAGQVIITERSESGKPRGWHFGEIDEPTDGFMIWIDQFENGRAAAAAANRSSP